MGSKDSCINMSMPQVWHRPWLPDGESLWHCISLSEDSCIYIQKCSLCFTCFGQLERVFPGWCFLVLVFSLGWGSFKATIQIAASFPTSRTLCMMLPRQWEEWSLQLCITLQTFFGDFSLSIFQSGDAKFIKHVLKTSRVQAWATTRQTRLHASHTSANACADPSTHQWTMS